MLWLAGRRFLPYIVAIIALMGAYFLIRADAYDDGVKDTTAKYEIAIREERERLIEANKKALEEARAREAELNRLIRERNAKISELSEQAASDPNADRPAVSIDGVFRLNRIR